MEQQTFVDTIYSDIKDAIGSIVGNRVYNIEAPQDTDLPCCVFQIVSDVFLSGMSCDDDDLDFQVLIYGNKSNGKKAIRDINDTLVSTLHRKRITDSQYNNSFYRNTLKGITSIDDKIVGIRSEYAIFNSH